MRKDFEEALSRKEQGKKTEKDNSCIRVCGYCSRNDGGGRRDKSGSIKAIRTRRARRII